MIKKSFLILVAFFLSVNSAFAEKPLRYMPYPIVFVSGITTHSDPGAKGSPSEKWPSTWLFDELRENFSNGIVGEITNIYDTEVQTQLGEIPHLEFFFYSAQEKSLAWNAELLRNEIKKILFGVDEIKGYYDTSNYTYTEPCVTPKVILICHSYGGVIGRAMLVNHPEMQDKVAAVFFIGVPQEGSPLSVIGYFLPKEIPILKEEIGKVDELINGSNPIAKRVYTGLKKKMESKITGNLKFMIWAENDEKKGGSLYTSTRDENDTRDLLAAINGNSKWLKLYNKLPPVKEKGTVKATLIPNELANKYNHTFRTHYYTNSSYGTQKVVVERTVPSNGPLSYTLSEAELYTLSTDVGNDIKKHAVVGTRTEPIREGLIGKANTLMGTENFNRHDYNLYENSLWNDGDGVVNLASQKAIPGAGASSQNTHEIDAMHTSVGLPIWGPLPFLAGELDHSATPNIILQAIEDAPVIESVRFEKAASDYIIVKVKDYLLADIEIAELTNADLTEFRDPTTGTYKPYFKYPNKGFLTERDVTVTLYVGMSKKIHLMPGEFHAKLTEKVENGAVYNIRIKNPAGRETVCQVVIPSQKDNGVRRYVDTGTHGYYSFQQFRENAIAIFLNSTTYYSYPDLPRPENAPYYYTSSIGGSAYSDLAAAATETNGPILYVYDLTAESRFAPLLEFNLAATKPVKSAKLIGRFTFNKPQEDEDFSVSLLNDNVSFVLNTASYESGGIFAIDVDPQYLTLNGTNSWTFSAEFLEDDSLTANCFPTNYNEPPVVEMNTPLIWTRSRYYQEAFIGNPFLMITFEEENQN